jgi:malyl-CoA/(S)-citramalyl-CoA lyase
MSFTIVEETTPRLNRSELSVPAISTRFLERAATSPADIVLLDLEDSVAPDDKALARKNAIEALNDLDWGERTISVRINGLDTPYMYRDVVDVVEQAGARLDLIMIPKVGTAADVYAVDVLVSQIEQAMGLNKRIGLELLVETALGMQNVEEIAASSRRAESLHFGVADYAASTGARTTNIGGPNPNYHTLTDPDDLGRREEHWGDVWHYPLSRVVVAARANGLRPVDGPYGNIPDSDGFRSQALRAVSLGCEGKWAIHPSQIEPANQLFSPSKDDVARARRILAAMRDAELEGRAAVSLDGRMIDIASVRQAQVMVKKARQIGSRSRTGSKSVAAGKSAGRKNKA